VPASDAAFGTRGTMPHHGKGAMDDAPGYPGDPPTTSAASEERWDGPRSERLGVAPPRIPEATSAWLHVVSGASVPALSRAVFELAARFLAGGHRVLLVDGAPKLRLHERFDRESRWGLIECLGGGLPVLGLVQDSGRLGLYLLALGTPDSTADWRCLGRQLEAARPHFGRVVIALDPGAPAVIGQALAGIHLEGWWPQGGSEARRAAGIGGRLGIQFADLNLDTMLVPRLEALDARVWGLLAPAVSPGDPDARPPEGEPIGAPQSEAPAPEVEDAGPPVSIDSDPRVRERLRFLLWTRQLGGAEGKPVPVGAERPGAEEGP